MLCMNVDGVLVFSSGTFKEPAFYGNQFYPGGRSDQNPQITFRIFGQSAERKEASN